MKMRRKVVKTSLLVIALMVSMTIPILAVTAKKKEWVIDPIIIDELGIGLPGLPGLPWADYADEPWLKGSGTLEDPYMIKNVVIDAKGSNFFCMMILNSDAYFKIMDCTFSNTGPGPDAGRNAALILASTQNGVIFKNEIFDCGNVAGQGSGIALIASSNNKVQKNFCHDNAGPGIYLQYSNDNVLRQNLCKRNQWGIMISEGSNNNEVTKNECYDNNEYGIFLYLEANNNLITQNECKDNFNSGIIVIQSHGNTISENDCSVNGNGIIIMYSNGNDVIDNVCSESFLEHGILVSNWAADNTIARNKCFKNARSGIVLYNMAYNNMITGNLCYENFESGTVIDSSFLNAVENNLVYGNSYTGMQLYYADNNMIAWNVFTENYIGIQLFYSNGNEITNNVCNENYDQGITGEYSNGNMIAENFCSENVGPGISFRSSNDNLITLNLCTGSPWGILLSMSNNNDVTKNECIENGEGIVVAYYANDNKITENNCTGNYENGVILAVNANYNIINQNNCSENLLSGIALITSSGTIISKNDCNNNGESGISIIGSDYTDARDNILYGNMIAGNLNGIHFSEADKNDIFMNTIKENDVGMLVEGQSELNLIFHNNFIDNVVQAVNERAGLNNWHNIYMLEGNYWNDYEGADDDGDGIGDIPWPRSDFDVHPFMEENGWEILTPIEQEILNARADPDTNRFGFGLVYQSTEQGYLIVGLGQLFSERTHDTWIPPFTCRLWFYQVVNGEVVEVESYFQGNLWSFEWSTFYQEPVWANLYFLIIPPNIIDLPPGEYPFKWGVSFYSGGEQQFMNFTTSFKIPEP